MPSFRAPLPNTSAAQDIRLCTWLILGLLKADDDVIWRRALQEGEVFISKDEDFALRRILATSGPQILWLRFGDCSNRALLAMLTPVWPQIQARLAAGDPLIEVV